MTEQVQFGEPVSSEPAAEFDPFARVISLGRSATSRVQLMSDLLRLLARFYRSPYAALHVRYASEVLHDDCHFGPTDPAFWKTGLQQFLTESLSTSCPRAKVLKSKQGNTRVAFLSTPVFEPDGPPIGAIALVVTPIDERDVGTCLARLEALSRLATAAHQPDHAPSPTQFRQSHMLAQSRAESCASVTELAFTITNELRNKLGCAQAALGMVRRGAIRILSISGMDDVKKQSPGVISLQNAMEECLDCGTHIASGSDAGWESTEDGAAYRLHKQWHVSVKGDAVASVPLRDRDRVVAVLSLRRKASDPFTNEQLEHIRRTVEPYAPALLLSYRANLGLTQHAMDAARGAVDSLREPGKKGRKVIAAMIAVMTLWFAFGSLNHDVAVVAVVSAARMRHVSAPYDGLLASADVLEGDRVAAGDVLCRLDDRELKQRYAELTAEMAVLERQTDRARADDSPFDVQLALAKQELVVAKLSIVQRRIEQSVVRATMDGVVVRGDLRKLVGSVLTRGDTLYQIAPFDEWTLELRVPEASSEDLTADLRGTFASYARPGDLRQFSIERVRAGAEVVEGRNVVVAEAKIDAGGDWLRPGMEGVARIRIGRRPVWWVALHRVIDFVRINLWI